MVWETAWLKTNISEVEYSIFLEQAIKEYRKFNVGKIERLDKMKALHLSRL